MKQFWHDPHGYLLESAENEYQLLCREKKTSTLQTFVNAWKIFLVVFQNSMEFLDFSYLQFCFFVFVFFFVKKANIFNVAEKIFHKTFKAIFFVKKTTVEIPKC